MSNETDLDWLVRNVHVWPAGDHQPWGYVYWKEGERHVSGNCITVIQPCVKIDRSDWLSRRAELQNKPSWEDAPEWAEWLAQDEDGEWKWLAGLPGKYVDGWTAVKIKGCCKGIALGDWRDTLEKRPEQKAFKPLTSIEDNQEKDMTKQQEMKQDNEWFERGELPPVGIECEWLECRQTGWQTVTVAGYYLNAAWIVPRGKEPISVFNPTGFRPIRTEREVLISVIIDEMNRYDTDAKLADAILAAGFKLEVK